MKKTRKTVKQPTESSLELVGGIFFVEKFKNGTERREELDGEVILKVIVSMIKDTLAKTR